MDKLINTRPVIKTVNVSKRGEYKTFSIPIPPNVKKLVGVLVLSTLSDTPIITSNRYFGIGNANQDTEAFILSLNKEHIESSFKVFNVTIGLGMHIYYAIPKRLGKNKFSLNGIAGGFKNPLTISVTDPETSFTEDYYLYESINDNLGDVTIEVI